MPAADSRSYSSRDRSIAVVVGISVFVVGVGEVDVAEPAVDLEPLEGVEGIGGEGAQVVIDLAVDQLLIDIGQLPVDIVVVVAVAAVLIRDALGDQAEVQSDGWCCNRPPGRPNR